MGLFSYCSTHSGYPFVWGFTTKFLSSYLIGIDCHNLFPAGWFRSHLFSGNPAFRGLRVAVESRHVRLDVQKRCPVQNVYAGDGEYEAFSLVESYNRELDIRQA